MDFSKLKKNRPSIEELSKKFESASGGGKREADERIMLLAPSRDSEGNAYKVIRLMPIGSTDSEAGLENPFVKKITYGFQGKGGWYFQTSRKTIGEDDPVYEENGKDYSLDTDTSKNRAKNRKQIIKYYSNIHVIKDKENPENDGKMMLLEYGPALFKMFEAALKPKFEDDPKFDPFDLWEGANFKIKIFSEEKGKDKNGKAIIMPNYDKSGFAPCGPLFDNDDDLKAAWDQCYSLLDIVDPDKIKSYDELSKELDRALGRSSKQESKKQEDFDDRDSRVSEPPQDKSVPEKVDHSFDRSEDSDEDDDMTFFKNLVKG